MAALTVQTVAEFGTDIGPGVAAGAGGDTVTVAALAAAGWDIAAAFLLVRNGGATAITVTVGSAAPVGVAAGAFGILPLHPGYSAVTINVTYSAVTSVTVAAVKLP